MINWFERRQLHPALRSHDEVPDNDYFDAITQTEQLSWPSITRHKPVTAITIRTRYRLGHSSPGTKHQEVVDTTGAAHILPTRELLAVASAETALAVPHILDTNS